MHAENLSYPVEIGFQGQCTISCIIFQVVQVVHVVKEGPKGIAQLLMSNFPNLKGANSSSNNARK